MGFYDTEASIATRPHEQKTAYPRHDFVESGHRAYSPVLARWPSRDPIGERGGLNLYGAMGNSPVARIDLFGQLGIQMIDGGTVKDASSNLANTGPNGIADYSLQIQFHDGVPGSFVMQFVIAEGWYIDKESCKKFTGNYEFKEWFRLDSSGKSREMASFKRGDGSVGVEAVDIHSLDLTKKADGSDGGDVCKADVTITLIYGKAKIAGSPESDRLWYGVLQYEKGVNWLGLGAGVLRTGTGSWIGGTAMWTEHYTYLTDDKDCCCVDDIPYDDVEISEEAGVSL